MGASYPKELISLAQELHYDSLCINDFDGVYGIARAYNERNQIKKEFNKDLKLNFGSEVHLFKDHEKPLLQRRSIALNAFNYEGYSKMCKLLSLAHKDTKDEAYIDLDFLLQQDLKGLYCVIPMRGGLDYFVNNKKSLEDLKSAFNNNLYLAKTRTFNNFSDSKIKYVNNLSKALDLRTIISQDVFYHSRNQKNFHDLITAIKNNLKVEEALDYFFPNGERSFHSKEEIFKMYSNFGDFKNCIQISEELNEKSSFCLSELKYKYPQEMIPEGFSSQAYLEKITWDNIKNRYKGDIPENVLKGISKELDLIEELKFADYFLTVWDIVRWAREQGILCQGRGSAANSAVCYVLGITSCDPALFDLLFERFISKERGDPPDIDVDFEHERREEVIQYIYSRYGRDKASMVANVITFRSKGSIRAVGKALGFSDSTLKTASNILSTVMHRSDDLEVVIDEVEKNSASTASSSYSSPEKRGVEPNMTTPPWGLWKTFAKKLKGFPRHMGLHSGGFVISQNPISHLVAQEPASMQGRTIIQWAKDDIEELGFFKIDILALGMLTALRKCFGYVGEHYGRDLNLSTIPQEDTKTYTMIQKAKTVGVFQIESRAQMGMLPRLKPKTFYDLVIEVAIIRPGPIQGNVIHPYLKRRDGLAPITYPNEKVKPILTKTLGLIIFQEQLMRIAIALGDFTPGEANELRKQVGSWNSKVFLRNLDPYIKKLLTGLKKNGVSKEFMIQMVEQMKGFAHYGFPESHAISFAFLAYASCYLKCHYPTAFFASVLNSQPMGFYSPHDLLQTAMQEGVKVLPLSVNHSSWDHSIEEVKVKAGRPKEFALRLGFRIVASLSKKAVLEIEDVRKKIGEWKNFDDFINSTSIYREDYSAIAAANGFHCFNLSRVDALWKAESVPFKGLIDIQEKGLKIRKRSEFEESQMDFSATGTSLKIHPVKIIKEKAWTYKLDVEKITTFKDIENLSSIRHYKKSSHIKNGSLIDVFGMVRVRQAPPTAKGMVFITIQDETGLINIAFTPQVYKKFYKSIEGSGFLCVRGVLQNVKESHSILVKSVYSPYSNETDIKGSRLDQTKKKEEQFSSSHLVKPRFF